MKASVKVQIEVNDQFTSALQNTVNVLTKLLWEIDYDKERITGEIIGLA